MKLSYFAFILFCFPLAAFCADINVPADYPTIQQAIDASVAGDSVIVAPGTYTENINFLGKDITVISADGPLYTVIDGNQSGSCAKFVTNETLSAVLEGFTITNGTGTVGAWGSEHGGGIFIEYAAPTIRNNVLKGNSLAGTYSGGGGIACFYDNALIANNIITDNVTTGTGGGLDIESCSATVENNVVMYNYAKGGGAIGINHSLPLVQNNIFSFNEASDKGGGATLWDASPTFLNNTFYGNTAVGLYGGAIYAGYNSFPTITNGIYWNNSAPLGKELKLGYGPVDITILFTNLEGGAASCSIDSGDNIFWGPGILDADPLFVDAANGDLHLTATSPCKDTGDISAAPPADFEGDPRTLPDMGADEFHPHLYYTGDATPSGTIEAKFIGNPGTIVNGIILGANVFNPPLPCDYGLWYMDNPMQIITGLGQVPSDGVVVIPGTIPGTPSGPYTIYLQAAIDSWLTNLCVLVVE